MLCITNVFNWERLHTHVSSPRAAHLYLLTFVWIPCTRGHHNYPKPPPRWKAKVSRGLSRYLLDPEKRYLCPTDNARAVCKITFSPYLASFNLRLPPDTWKFIFWWVQHEWRLSRLWYGHMLHVIPEDWRVHGSRFPRETSSMRATKPPL